ncbi:PREDICTED: cytotoxic and regulatory T-cell molecule [Tinamus guttatus]|uniref:cytotoxic and regulatory T-cell molecule n=1 Tax=Tinamus guttatus TaxID=94827 RepID=UPI00052EFACF|nr:PREDICTED: cytotoxic and regulatory T-cell molecule [Tinamus guttatus]
MSLARVLHAAALLLLAPGCFPGAAGDTVTLQEGQALQLRCRLGGASGAARQWLDPRGFVLFLNARRGLKDQRLKLIHYSKKELSIQLSNITVRDEGVYKCFYYGTPFKTKNKTVKVLAAPSKPVVQVSQDTEKGITLSCYTKGSRPQPRISWLLDNGIELPGATRHTVEADGRRWSTRSTLTVLAHRPGATATCVAHHRALGEDGLAATFRFGSGPAPVTTTHSAPTAVGTETTISENAPSKVKEPLLFALKSICTVFRAVSPFSPASTAKSDLNSSTAFSLSYPQFTGEIFTSTAAGDEEGSGTWSYNVPNGTETTFHGTVTQELYRTEASSPTENSTMMTTLTFKQDLKNESIKKEKNLLLPVLVAALIFVLLIIVLLFMRKLKKAHGQWKRENDASEQTLESYKSRSNEDNSGPEKNKQVVNHKSDVQSITNGYVETTQKNPTDKSFAIAEKLFACGKETDV